MRRVGWVAALCVVAAPLHAQQPALPQVGEVAPGWVHEVGLAGIRPNRVVCSQDHVFVQATSQMRVIQGQRVEDPARLWRSDAHTRTELPNPPEHIGPISVSPGNHLYATYNDGSLAHFDGASWSRLPVSGPAGEVVSLGRTAILAFDPEHVYLAGAGGMVARVEGDRVVAYASGSPHQFNAIAGTSPTDMWFAGEYETLMHWDGTHFTQETLPTERPRGHAYFPTLQVSGERVGFGGFLRTRGVWAMVDGPGDFFLNAAGLLRYDRGVLETQRGTAWVPEMRAPSFLEVCATSTQLIVATGGREEFGGATEVHERGDILHRQF